MQTAIFLFIFLYAHHYLIFVPCTVTINEYGSLPSMECIILDNTIFLLTGAMSAQLLWFKLKLMRLVTNGNWETFCRTASAYYGHCMVINEAMGLWILHYWDINTIIKKEDDDIKKEDDNINEHSSEAENNNKDKDDNKDDKNKKDRKKESHSNLHRSGKILIDTFCTYKNHLVQS